MWPKYVCCERESLERYSKTWPKKSAVGEKIRRYITRRDLETSAVREKVWRDIARHDLETSAVKEKVWR